MSNLDQRMRGLLTVLKAKEDAQKSKMAAIHREENHLREVAAKLDHNKIEAMQCDPTLKQLGVDIAQLRWIGERRREVNLRLANVLARKESSLQDYRMAFGRTQSLQNLAAQNKTAEVRKKASQEIEKSLAHALFRTGKS